MDLRRVCQVTLTAGLLVVAFACGDVERASLSPTTGKPGTVVPVGRARSVTRDLAPRPRASLDVLRTARAISYVLEAIAPPTTVPPVTVPDSATPTVVRTWPSSYQPCDGAYPPCWRVATESGGNYNAINPGGCGGSGCYGKWQFSGEWACKLGLPCDLSTATPAQQDEAARLLWNGGAGCGNWDAC